MQDLNRILEHRYAKSIRARILTLQQAVSEGRDLKKLIQEIKAGEQKSLEQVLERATLEYVVK